MGTRLIALAALIGVLLPGLAEVLRPYLGGFVLLMLIVSLLRVDFAAFVERVRRPLRATSAALWITVFMPLSALGALSVFGGDAVPAVAFAVLFLFVTPPPIVSAPAFAMLMGLDGALVLAVMLISTIAMPITAPLIADAFVNHLPIDPGTLAIRLAVIIAVAFLVAAVLRRIAGPDRISAAKPMLDTASVAIAILFAIGAMDGVLASLIVSPLLTLGVAIGGFTFMLCQIALTYAVFRPAVGADAVAIAYAAGNRNAGLVLAAVGVTAVDPVVWLFFSMSQLPIFIFPLILKPLGQRLSRRTAKPSVEGAPT